MKASPVTDNIYRLGEDVHDILFESMWPIPHGVTMNSYIVRGERTAIIDGVCGWDGVPDALFAQLSELGIPLSEIDYVVLNHLEPDHTGWIRDLLEITSDFTIVTTAKGVELARAFFDLDVRFVAVSSGDVLDLGRGVVLQFEEIPNVHWPETMATIELSSGTLFSGDAFGSFGAVGNRPFDDEHTEEELRFFETESVRYFANIVGAFHKFVERALAKIAPLEPQIIAPAHGLVWRRDPDRILSDYARYASYGNAPAEPLVTVIWASMYGMSRAGLEPVLRALRDEGVATHVHNVPEAHISDILSSVWQSTGVVIACPTYEYKMFPPMAAVIEEIGRKRARGRKAFRLGSYGWSGGAEKELHEICERTALGWNFLESVEFKGMPTPEHLEKLYQRGTELGQEVLALCHENLSVAEEVKAG